MVFARGALVFGELLDSVFDDLLGFGQFVMLEDGPG